MRPRPRPRLRAPFGESLRGVDPVTKVMELIMNKRLLTCSLTLGLLSTSALAHSGGQGAQQKTRQGKVPIAEASQEIDAAKSRNFHRDDEILSMDLWTMAGGQKTDLGDINDFVIDSSDGAITHVIISSGGVGSLGDTLRAIAWDDIQWSEDKDAERVASVKHAEEEFKAIPAFEKKDVKNLVGRGTVEAAAKRLKGAKKDMDKKAGEEATAAARAAAMKGARHHLASSLHGLDIYGPGEYEPFCSIGELVVNCDEGHIAYVTVEANDKEYLVPFSVLMIKPVLTADRAADRGADRGADVEYAAYAPVNEAGMVGAPTIDAKAQRTAQEPRFRQMVAKHYKTDAVKPAAGASKAKRAPSKSSK